MRETRGQIVKRWLMVALEAVAVWTGACLGLNAASAPAETSASAPNLRLAAGGLEIGLRGTTHGVRLESLYDSRFKQELLASNAPALFDLTLRHVVSKKEIHLGADAGWRQSTLRKTRGGFEARWAKPADETLSGVAVRASAEADPAHSAWRWKLGVENASTNWSVWRVVFPQLAVADLGTNALVFFPRGPGEVQSHSWNRPFQYHGNYPGGWCAMQFMAVYRDGEQPTGLYVAMHDPWGGTKDLALKSEPAKGRLAMRFDHPAPDMGVAGNDFTLSGEAVWRLLRGDWFDAAMIYKAWARREARWWPHLTAQGRADTPLWMRQLNVWALGGGASSECVANVEQFRNFVGLPAGFHWYNWHQIPFDNDYPHYFPARTNFAEGVRALKQAGVFVMPYINGRLWDSHDRGAEDFEFTRLALPAATKNPEGAPYLESYGSKETNGQPVRLAAMCPATAFWRQTVRDTALKLLQEVGTSGIYIDQVAAAAPALCMDSSHGHPLGGGHWWNEGYWKMLDAIRRAKPRDAMLTTECNGEPFVRWFDGYLTWHWQHDGQVPAFPAVYGGAVQMFGRAYRGGATKDLALRMKAAQQLVFGEQLGWLDPGVVKEKENAEFFRQLVQLRGQFSRYFYAGEMARPPKLHGPIPTVKADWQWSGEWWVATDAVLTGAWQLPKENQLVLLFANVSDSPVSARLSFNPAGYAIRARKLKLSIRSSAGAGARNETLTGRFERQIVFEPRQAQAWEMSW